MVERGTGRIIFVSSVIGETGNIGQANYAASQGRHARADQDPREGDCLQSSPGQAGRLTNGVGNHSENHRPLPGSWPTEMLERHPRKGAGQESSSGQSRSGRLCNPTRSHGWSTSWAADASAYITGTRSGAFNGGLDM